MTTTELEETGMKYMLMTFGDRSTLGGKSPDWIKGMIDFMIRIDGELVESGELLFQQGLADPSEARTVRAPHGNPHLTEGPYLAPRQSLAGFWVVDVDSEARAIAIANRIATAAESAIEVRMCVDAPPNDGVERSA